MNVRYEVVDIQSYDAVSNAVKKIVESGTKIDILVNNVSQTASCLDIDIDNVERQD